MANTLSQNELMMDVIDAFKVRFPLMSAISTDFSNEEATLGSTVTSRVMSLPTVADYGSSNGYENGATEANSLSTDIPVTIDRHKHVPVRVDYINQISTKRDLYNEAVGNLAYALGKEAFDTAMGMVVEHNFSQSTIEPTAQCDKDTLDGITAALNAKGVSPVGRFGIVNSDVYAGFEGDNKIASGDFHGQQRGSNAYGTLENVAGFERIFEYPSMPTNNHAAGDYTRDENLTGFFGDRTALTIAARIPADVERLANSIGIQSISTVETVTDPDTGLTLMGITFQKPGTFDVFTTLTWNYGLAAGSQACTSAMVDNRATDATETNTKATGYGTAPTAGTKLDFAGHRLISAATSDS